MAYRFVTSQNLWYWDSSLTIDWLQLPDEDDNVWKDGLVTFLSFTLFGAMPLLVYCIFPFAFPHIDSSVLFGVACGLTALTLFVLGVLKSIFSVHTWWYSGGEMVLIGATVSAAAYLIGLLVNFLR